MDGIVLLKTYNFVYKGNVKQVESNVMCWCWLVIVRLMVKTITHARPSITIICFSCIYYITLQKEPNNTRRNIKIEREDEKTQTKMYDGMLEFHLNQFKYSLFPSPQLRLSLIMVHMNMEFSVKWHCIINKIFRIWKIVYQISRCSTCTYDHFLSFSINTLQVQFHCF